MNSDVINIVAELTLYSKENGGRESGIKTGYRPNHVLEYLPNSNDFTTTYIGQIDFDKELIFPGETENVRVMFLKHPYIEKSIKEGRSWWIYEGSKKIGEAKVLQII